MFIYIVYFITYVDYHETSGIVGIFLDEHTAIRIAKHYKDKSPFSSYFIEKKAVIEVKDNCDE